MIKTLMPAYKSTPKVNGFIPNNHHGFTLLEVIISITILAFISIYTAESIQSGLKSKAKIHDKLDNQSLLEDALKVMDDDIQLAFHYRDIDVEIFNKAQKQRKKDHESKSSTNTTTGNGQTTSNPAQGSSGNKTSAQNQAQKIKYDYTLKKDNSLTQFVGDKDQLNFTSLSYSRTIANSLVSNQAEVGYYLRNCKNRTHPDWSSRCLVRRINPYIDDKIGDGGTETVLLENVVKFQLRYLGTESENWLDTWASNESGDAVTKGNFPFAVEITLKIQNKHLPKSKPLEMTIVSQIEFPNNLDKNSNSDDTNGGTANETTSPSPTPSTQ